MANGIVTLNFQVTKRQMGDSLKYEYIFPYAKVYVYDHPTPSEGQISILATPLDERLKPNEITYKFSEITENYGTTTIQEYADFLAGNGAYQPPLGGSSPIEVEFPEAYRDKSGAAHVESILTDIDLKQTKDELPLFYDTVLVGTATSTYNQTLSGSELEVFADGDIVIEQTFERFNYETGKTKKIDSTAHNFAIQTDVLKRFGYFSSDSTAPYENFDGLYLESNGVDSEYYAVIAKKGEAPIKSPRSEWDDPLDGTGASGITIDFDNFLINRIKFLWLGGGPVSFSFETNDTLITFKTFKNGNEIENIYIQSPNQPVRYEIRSVGGVGKFVQVCATVGNYGGNATLGTEHGITSYISVPNLDAGNEYVVYAFRLKQTHLDVTVKLLNFIFQAQVNDDFITSILINPTFTGDALIFIDQPNSAVQIATGTNGTLINPADRGFETRAGNGQGNSVERATSENVLRLGSSIDGTSSIIAFTVRPITDNLTATSSTNWLENN